jgi:hypothetical protein
VRFVEIVTEAGHAAAGHYSGVTLRTPSPVLGGFHLLGDFIDVGVQRLQQFLRLRDVGVIDHVGIIASTAPHRAAGKRPSRDRLTWPGPATGPSNRGWHGNGRAVAY